jgi:Cu/Ag efflux pump CusA
LREDPLVESVVGKIGRAESAIDPAPVNMTETVINFKAKDAWPAGTTKETILQRLDREAASARRHQHLDSADPQPYRHAFDRHPYASWSEGFR